MKNSSHFFFAIWLAPLALAFLVGCASANKKIAVPKEIEVAAQPTESPSVSLWSARMQVENLETEKKERVDLEVMAKRPSSLKMEVKGTFGVVGAVGSLEAEMLTLVLPRQKKAYKGQAGPESLKPFLHIPLDPKILLPIFFDEAIAGWSCSGEKLVDLCTKDNLKVQILERSEAKRRVQLNGPSFVATLIIRSLGTKVLSQKDVFKLDVPEGYKLFKLP